MRLFYENWQHSVNRQPMADEIDWNEFLSISFSHNIEILTKTSSLDERKFYIHECAIHAWNKYTLREYIQSGLYQKKPSLPNNFDRTMTDAQYAVRATMAFKENYMLDFINIENLGEPKKDYDERVIENEIVNNIKDFIIRFGTDFIFMGNQYRIEIAGEEMFIDLLSYLQLPDQRRHNA